MKARVIVDLGCGDFVVGKALVSQTSATVRYHGVDIVEDVVVANRVKFAGDRVEFSCLDGVEGGLPPGDVCLIRQVLQHLSNEDISRILETCRATYPYVVITEHEPNGHFRSNRDKPRGPDTRLLWGSAVVVSDPPFSLGDVRRLWEFPEPTGGVLRTYLWTTGKRSSLVG